MAGLLPPWQRCKKTASAATFAFPNFDSGCNVSQSSPARCHESSQNISGNKANCCFLFCMCHVLLIACLCLALFVYLVCAHAALHPASVPLGGGGRVGLFSVIYFIQFIYTVYVQINRSTAAKKNSLHPVHWIICFECISSVNLKMCKKWDTFISLVCL